jgi:hypothetical protein|tara:strand:+ start:495 stop:635 length:141 start_codon:yes stop_codon:yes gene_type:complete
MADNDNDNQDIQEVTTAPIIYGVLAVTIIGAWIYSDPSINLSTLLS